MLVNMYAKILEIRDCCYNLIVYSDLNLLPINNRVGRREEGG